MTREKTNLIMKDLYDGINTIFPNENMEMILFGSYARGDNDDGSDIDVMFLVDSSRDEIAKKNWQIGDLAGELLVEYGILVSPIIENRNWFTHNMRTIPLYKNIMKEGISINV